MEGKSSYQGKASLIILTLGKTTQEEADIQGLNVLEILNKKHNVEILNTATSKRLNCIDDVCANNRFWWKFFVNEKPILSSVDKYYPKDGDIILLEYGEE